jgi:transketolase C-terminal domain/subunit
MDNYHQSQRGYFAGALYEEMKKDESIYLIIVDLGYETFDKHFKDFPDRCINTGASEQAAMGIAVGLALQGKKPFIYTISSFFMRIFWG